ncbi:MAG: hypothetical protein Q8M03_09670 [Legionella sp.]|nr:hypothetical protein [Legionella sp.]
MIRRLFWTFLSITVPWLVLLIYDNPGGAFVALVMQATVIGWIPASLWALRVVNEARTEAKKARMKAKAAKKTKDA